MSDLSSYSSPPPPTATLRLERLHGLAVGALGRGYSHRRVGRAGRLGLPAARSRTTRTAAAAGRRQTAAPAGTRRADGRRRASHPGRSPRQGGAGELLGNLVSALPRRAAPHCRHLPQVSRPRRRARPGRLLRAGARRRGRTARIYRGVPRAEADCVAHLRRSKVRHPQRLRRHRAASPAIPPRCSWTARASSAPRGSATSRASRTKWCGGSKKCSTRPDRTTGDRTLQKEACHVGCHLLRRATPARHRLARSTDFAFCLLIPRHRGRGSRLSRRPLGTPRLCHARGVGVLQRVDRRADGAGQLLHGLRLPPRLLRHSGAGRREARW